MDGPAQRRRLQQLGRRSGPRSWIAGLSSRRRALVAGIAVLLVVAVATAAVALTKSNDNQSPSSSPGSNVVAQSRPGPVLLVPGYGGNAGALDELAARIRATGRRAIIVHLPGNGMESLVGDATALNDAVSAAMRRGAPSVDVIGYSAGGVVALLWARRDNGAAVARRIVTLGSPFHGTRLASAAAGFVPGACPIACQQLIPGSSLLASLNVDSPDRLPDWLSLWTKDDMVVTPPDSARLAGAIDVQLQSVCPELFVTHSQLPTDPTVMSMVLHAIGGRALQRPSAADCRG